MKRPISRLQYITTSATLTEEACSGGVDWVQLRLKDVSYDEYRNVALEVKRVCKKYNATFIINDNIQLALDINADGVHVGKEDPLPPEDVERMLARDGIIGATANDIEDFKKLSGKPISYIGLGPFRFTETKKKLSPILGLDGYEQLFAGLKEQGISYPPVVGIGGITIDDVTQLLGTGLHGIAVSGAISNAADIKVAAKTFRELIYGADMAVVKTITIAAPVAKVWHNLTSPELMKEWLFDSPIYVDTDWQQGSPITFSGTWYKKPYTDKGVVLKVSPGQLLRYSQWSHLSKLADSPENYTTIQFTLQPANEGTMLSLNHSNFILSTMYHHSNFYWTVTLDRLKKLIERNV